MPYNLALKNINDICLFVSNNFIMSYYFVLTLCNIGLLQICAITCL